MDVNKPVVVHYERQEGMVRLTLTNITNHEVREVITGLWARLSEADRVDQLAEMVVYQADVESWLGPIAVVIKQAGSGKSEVDLIALRERGEKVRP